MDTHSDLINNIAHKKCQNSFAELFSFYSHKLYNYGLANQLNDSLANDLVQEVMTRVWTKSSYYNSDKGNVSTWIFTIARNIRFDLLRKKVRESNLISSEDIWNLEAQSLIIDQDADQEELLQQKELKEVLNKLPEQQKDVINKVYLKGLTQDEYAKEMKLPLGTVKSRIRLGIRKLNNLLESK